MALLKVGDMAILVRGHKCVLNDFGGVPFRVDNIKADSRFHCSNCGLGYVWGADSYTHVSNGLNLPLSWLKRIPPLSDLEGLEDSHDIPAPVEHA